MCSIPSCERCQKCQNCFKNKVFDVVIGIVIGSMVCLGYVLYEVISRNTTPGGAGGGGLENASSRWWDENGGPGTLGPFLPEKLVLRKPLYVGILSMDRYLDTRAASCHNTWATHPAISKLEFFARLPRHRHKPAIVNLTGVTGDDSFHRQESFEMLKYICDHHIEEYDWFVRTVDDSYLRPDHLFGLLATLDKGRMFYLGHPSLGAEDYDIRVSAGHDYCLGGPGVVFSRTALKGLCPHLDSCKKKYTEGSADAEIGRCVREVLGVECTTSSKFRERFYNSYERNTFKLVDEFLRQDSALSFHPLKTPWLMEAVHKHVDSGALSALSQRLSWLRGRASTLLRNVLTDNVSRYSLPTVEHLTPTPLTVVTSSNLQLNPGACSPVTHMTPSATAELAKTLDFTKASFMFGNKLKCHEFINGQVLRSPGVATNYTLNLACTDTLRPNVTLLGKARLKIPLAGSRIKTARYRSLHTKLVVLLHGFYGDPKVMEFLIMWKNLMRHKTPSDSHLVLFLVYDALQQKHSTSDMDVTIPDLDRWKRDRKLNLETYVFNNTVSISKMHQMALGSLDKRFQDAVLLLVRPHLTFDNTFLQKCRLLVRPGKRIYKPYAEHTVIFKHESTSSEPDSAVHGMFWNSDSSPVCIHRSDLVRKGKKQPKTGRSKRLKIIRSFDLNLHLEAT